MNELLKGVVIPIITPLNEDQTINIGALTAVAQRCLNSGANAVFAFGTGGEGYALNDDQMAEAAGILIKHIPGKLIVGVMQPSTNVAVRFINLASAAGARVFAAVPPYYMDDIKQEHVIDHFTEIAKYAERFVIYNIPGTTGINILPETVLEIKNKCRNCIGIKNSGADLNQLKTLINMVQDSGFSVMQGNCSFAVEGLRLGARGIIPVVGNIFPDVYVNLYNAVMENQNVNDLLELCRRVERIEEFEAGWMASIKAAMNAIGVFAGIPALPYRPADESQVVKITEYIRNQLGVLMNQNV